VRLKNYDESSQPVKNVFAENCVVVVFIMAMVLNLILPRDKQKA